MRTQPHTCLFSFIPTLVWVIGSVMVSHPLLGATIDRVLSTTQQELKSAQDQLASTREKIALERADAHQVLERAKTEAQQQQIEATELQAQLERLETSEANAKSEWLQLRSEVEQVVQLIEDFQADFESRIHVAELRPYRERRQPAPTNETDAEESIGVTVQPLLNEMTITADRIERQIGGTIYPASVLTPDERIIKGKVAQLGPLAYFQGDGPPVTGIVTQHPSVYEPALVPADEDDSDAIAALIANQEARIPIDPSGVRLSRYTGVAPGWVDHLREGGPVMIPILALAMLATLIALFKSVQLARLGTRTPHTFTDLVRALNQRDLDKAQTLCQGSPQPQADLILYGIEHYQKSRLLLEELLEERIFVVKARLERALPWIAVTAASAPLLGLLGTVTGMIDTFGLIAAYGTGDPKLLSSGISEALITTKFGLGMAIPAMLVHAFLNRKVKRVIVAMEQTAWRFVNELHAQQADESSEEVER